MSKIICVVSDMSTASNGNILLKLVSEMSKSSNLGVVRSKKTYYHWVAETSLEKDAEVEIELDDFDLKERQFDIPGRDEVATLTYLVLK